MMAARYIIVSYIKYCLVFLVLIIPLQSFAGSGAMDSISVFNYLDSIYIDQVENNPGLGMQLSQRQQAIASQLKNDSLLVRAGINRARGMSILGLLDVSLKEYYSVLGIAERDKMTFYEGKIYYRLGMVYQTLNDFPKSNEYLLKGKAKFIGVKSYIDTVLSNYELGFNCIANNEDDKGIAIIERNLDCAKKAGDDVVIVLGLDNLSIIYADKKQNEKALSYLLEIFKYPGGIKSNYRKTGFNEHITELYVIMKQWDNARKYLAETFKYAKALNSCDWLFECYKLQSQIEEGAGNYKAALEAHKLYLDYKDSVFRKEYENKIAGMTTVYELEKKQGQISLLEKDNLINKAKIKQKVFQRNAAIGGSVLLVGLVVLAFLGWLQRKTQHMQVAFSRSLIQGQEAERQRISRELHDSIGQNILFIKNQLLVQNNTGAMAPIMEAITATMEEIRNISKELYPNQLEKYGLSAAVEALAEKVAAATGIFVSADLHEVEPLLGNDAKINFFRIIQESINNVIKHAGAKAMRITGSIAHDKIVLLIQDNGKGFDTAILERKSQASFGLLNMEERAKMMNGKMELETGATGTKITISIPVKYEN